MSDSVPAHEVGLIAAPRWIAVGGVLVIAAVLAGLVERTTAALLFPFVLGVVGALTVGGVHYAR